MRVFDVRAEFQGGFTTKRTKTDFIVVHHAAALYPQKTGIEDVRAVANYHTKSNGWAGIGYHEALAEEVQGGTIAAYILSDPYLMRANVAYRNDVIYGISCLTNFVDLPEQKWIDALAERIAAALLLFPNARVVGHKEITVKGWETACPGVRWFDWKPTLLARVKDYQITTQLPVMSPPRMRREAWIKVLTENKSPATPQAEQLWDIVAKFGIDPAVALAIFNVESKYGTEGICAFYDTKNWGNVRTPHKKELSYGSTMAGGGFAKYDDWAKGLEDWCWRIVEKYGDQMGRKTVETILPIYAPYHDKNDPMAYARKVRSLVESYGAIYPTVDQAFIEAYKASGGAWKAPGVLTPGLPLESAFLCDELLYQIFERGAIRRNKDGSMDWLFTEEIVALKQKRLA